MKKACPSLQRPMMQSYNHQKQFARVSISLMGPRPMEEEKRDRTQKFPAGKLSPMAYKSVEIVGIAKPHPLCFFISHLLRISQGTRRLCSTAFDVVDAVHLALPGKTNIPLHSVQDRSRSRFIVEKLGEPTESYEDFTASLPENKCRYAVYDFDFMTEENVPKSRIFFIAWSPDISRVRSKMIYASSKDRFKRELYGIQMELQATDPSEMALDVFNSRAR